MKKPWVALFEVILMCFNTQQYSVWCTKGSTVTTTHRTYSNGSPCSSWISNTELQWTMIFCEGLCCPQEPLQMSSWLPLVTESPLKAQHAKKYLPPHPSIQVSMAVCNDQSGRLLSLYSQFTYRPSTQLFMQASNRHSIHVHVIKSNRNSY